MAFLLAFGIILGLAAIPALLLFVSGMNHGDRRVAAWGAGLYCAALPVALGFPLGAFSDTSTGDSFDMRLTATGWTSAVTGVAMGIAGLVLLASQAGKGESSQEVMTRPGRGE